MSLTKEEVDDAQLRDLCKYGAEAHRRDPKILPLFHIMGCEVKLLKDHMAAVYPDVPYKFDYPTAGAPERV